jgi:hypothetical protein
MMTWEDSLADTKKYVAEALRESLRECLHRPIDQQTLTRLRIRAEQILKNIAEEAKIPAPEVEVEQNPEDPYDVRITLPPGFMLLLISHREESA